MAIELEKKRQMLTCFCCGTIYEKGHYRCCAPPANVTPAAWLARHCHKCAGDPKRLRSNCPNHCTCPKEPVSGVENFGAFRESKLAAELAARKAVGASGRHGSGCEPGGGINEKGEEGGALVTDWGTFEHGDPREPRNEVRS